ncbi:hypothetical protein [Flavobacterium sp.]|uniref:hypothetical protein n=1 Tax=Flavobacterium sp. TaxID=239 RepID=UPI004047F74A
MENLILEWQKRQQKYEELADKYKDDAHNNRKFTYKAMATRDCWKELALQLQQTGVVRSCSHNFTTNYCNSDGSYSHKMCDDCGDVIWD